MMQLNWKTTLKHIYFPTSTPTILINHVKQHAKYERQMTEVEVVRVIFYLYGMVEKKEYGIKKSCLKTLWGGGA